MEQSHHNSLEYVVAVLHSGKCKNGYCRIEARSIETNEPVPHRPGPHWLVPARSIIQAFAKERGVAVPTVEPDIKWFHGTGHRTGKYRIWAVVGFTWADGEQDILEMFLVDQDTIQIEGLRRIELTGIPMFADSSARGREAGQ